MNRSTIPTPRRRRAAAGAVVALVASVLSFGVSRPAFAAEPAFTVSGASIVEGTGSALLVSVAVSRSGPASGSCNLVVTAVLSGSSTASAADFTTIDNPQNFSVAAGDVTRVVRPTSIIGDALDESDETFTVVISGAPFSTTPACEVDPAAASATFTIVDDDGPAPPPVRSVSVSDVSIVEGNTGTTTASFTLNLSGTANGNESVEVATSNGSATAGSDYVPVPATLVSFPAGVSARTVSVTINGDTTVEPDETFDLVVSAPSNVTVADGIGLGTIRNDDAAPPPPPVTVSIANVSRAEGNSGPSVMVFPVTASQPVPSTCGFSFTVTHGTTNSADLTTVAGSGTVTAGTSASTVQVTVSGDRDVEPNETFTVRIVGSGSASCSIGAGVATGTITNDDAPHGKDKDNDKGKDHDKDKDKHHDDDDRPGRHSPGRPGQR